MHFIVTFSSRKKIEDGSNIEMLNNLIHVDYFWAFDEPRQIRAAALSQYLDSLKLWRPMAMRPVLLKTSM